MTARLFERIVADIHDATLDPSRWSGVLKTISSAAGAVGAALIVRNQRAGFVEWACFYGPCADARDDYFTYYARLDPFTRLLGANRAKWLRLTDCIASPVLEGDVWYNDFVLKCGIVDALAMQTDKGPYTITLGLHEAANRVPLRASLGKILQRLVEPVGRAVEVQLRLRDSGLKVTAGRVALGLLSAGFLVVDATSRIVQMNNFAKRVLSLDDGLIVRNGCLKALWPIEDVRLATAIHLVLVASEQGVANARTEQVTVHRREIDRNYLVSVTPLGVSLEFSMEPFALVLITHQEGLFLSEAK